MKKDYRLMLNTITSILLEIVIIVCGLVLPRAMLVAYGSDVNGLVQSITQFLTIISALEMGVGSVIRFNLYKPLAYKDDIKLSHIYVASNRFFRNIALGLLVYLAALTAIFPFFGKGEFDRLFTAVLIVVMSISSFAQYLFGQTNQILLTADQKGYIQYTAQLITILVNTVASVLLIECGVGIQGVKLCTASIYLVRPIFLQLYVKRHYNINTHLHYEEEPIKQKWNGIAQHISAVVLDQTDIIVLTVLSTLANVSIYSTYYMVVSGVKKIITRATNGIQAKLGYLIARDEKEELRKVFAKTEWVIHGSSVVLFGSTLVLIVPFVNVYTKGIDDANYNVPVFAFLITMAYAVNSFRLPYHMLILSGGHYRETQGNYIITSIMNIVISVILVWYYGLVGVAIGTLVAMSFQTIWMGWYSYTIILHDNIKRLFIQLAVDGVSLLLAVMITSPIKIVVEDYYDWCILAAIYTSTVTIVVIIINALVYRSRLVTMINEYKKSKRSSGGRI